jgi:hypothetical protein
LRRPKSALGAAFVALGLSAQFAPAQQMSRESGSDQNPAKSSSAIDPALANRSARYLLRNGVDYLNYQEYTRALRFLRAAESREKELNADELRTLKQGILQAQRGLREPAPSDRLARSRRPGALAVASPPAGQPTARDNDGIQLAAATRSDDRLPPLPDANPAFDQDREPAAVRTASPAPSPTTPPASVAPTALPEPTPLGAPSDAASKPSQPAGPELPPIRDLPPVAPEQLPTMPPGPSAEPIRARAEATPPARLAPAEPTPLPDLPPAAGIPPVPAGMPPASTAPPVPLDLPPVNQAPAPSQNPAPPTIGLDPLPEPTKPVEAPAASLPPMPTPVPGPLPIQAPTSRQVEPVTPVSLPDQPGSLPPMPTPVPDPVTTQAPASRPAEPAALPALPDQPVPTPPATTPLPEPGPAPLPATAAAASPPPTELPPLGTSEPVPTPTPASVTPPPADEPRPAPGQPAVAAGPAPAAEELPNRSAAEPAPTNLPPARTEATVPAPRSFSPEVEAEIARIAEAQDRDTRNRPPVPPELSGPIRPGAPPPGTQLPANPADATSISASSRFIIERAPSPTEAWPIRRIPVPEEFVPLAARNFAPSRKYWQAPALCHMPLYFQDAALERYGHSVENYFGPAGRYLTYPIDDPKQSKMRFQILQPAFSAGLMAFQIGTLPYKLLMDPPWEAEYDLGYYRPGDRVPTDIFYFTPFGVGPPLAGKNY